MKLAAGLLLAERYRLSHRIGEGGMGQVWAATHVVTGRRVAIKRLFSASDDPIQGDQRARLRFVREAQAACAVEHPNVVEVLDFLQPENEPPLLVMELLEGETLSSKLSREQALDLAETAELLLPVVSAVGTAHARGIVHRDLKPSNVFLHTRDRAGVIVKVLDFGIAKWIAQGPHGPGELGLRTETGSTLGTPCYMAPEQALGERGINHTVDVWSIGVILYECLTGARPVEGENAAQMVVRLLNTGIIPIERILPNLPPGIAKLIGSMLSRDPTRRPKDLREVSCVLREHTHATVPDFDEPALPTLDPSGEEVSAQPSSPPVVWTPRTEPEAAQATPERPSAKHPPQRTPVWGPRRTVALASVLLLAAGIFYVRATSDANFREPHTRTRSTQNAPAVESRASLASVRQEVTASELAPAAIPQLPSAAPPTIPSPRRPPRPSPSLQGVPAPATSASTLGLPGGLPRGGSCEHSRECESRLCVAFVCE